MVSRLVGLSLLLGATACATANQPRVNLTPKDGPRASVYANYFGGLTARTVRTTFRTTKDAHVIVGRLGGDGRIEILYPETPQASTKVASGKTYSARTFAANYDGVPQMYSYASRANRSFSARQDSYDGLGNGFIFIIATQYPMFTDALDDHGAWSDSVAVDDYFSTDDPRYAIHDFAEVLTRGMPYTLDYADSFRSQGFSSYADGVMDCTSLSSMYSTSELWHLSHSLAWMSGSFDPIGLFYTSQGRWLSHYSPYVGCGFAHDRMGLAYDEYLRGLRYRYGYGYGWGPAPGQPTTPTATPKLAPTTKVTFNPTTRRPGFRNGSESGSALNLARTRFDGQRDHPRTTTSSFAPPPLHETRVTDRNDHFERANSSRSYSAGGMGSTRTEGVTSFHPSTPAVAPAPAPAPAPHPVSHPVTRPEKPNDP